MSEEHNGALAEYLKEHPRMMGVLFTMLLLLSQTGVVAAGNHVTTGGP